MRTLILTIGLATASAIAAVESPKEIAKENQTAESYWLNLADLMTGKKIASTSTFYEFSKTEQYVKYQRSVRNALVEFLDNSHLLKEWAGAHVSSKCTDLDKRDKKVLYPFSGPDINNALSTFPQAEQYTMFGLEFPGVLEANAKWTNLELSAQLADLQKSVDLLLHVNFFKTKDMEKDLKTKSLSSITGAIIFFLRALDYQPISVKNIYINENEELVVSATVKTGGSRFGLPGVEILFKDSHGDIKTVRYFRADVSDGGLKNSSRHFPAYLVKNGSYSTIIKSASYLMHETSFSTIRNLILKESDIIVQDDTGLPFNAFSTSEWDLGFHGIYEKPIALFRSKFQPLYAKEMKEKSTGPLAFVYGYGKYSLKGSNVLTAFKKVKETKCPKK